MFRHRFFWYGLPLALIVFAGCGDRAASPSNAGSKSATAGTIKVVATVGMVGDLVRQVGGDHVTIKQLCGSGVDPHQHKPTRDDVQDIMWADLVFYCGLHLEGKMEDRLSGISRSKPTIAVAESIPSEKLIAGEAGSEHGDPHVWNDVQLWSQCLDPIVKALSELDPSHAETFQANASTYRAEMLALHAWGKEAIASIPQESRVLITSHDAFSYFGRAYGIEVLGVQGISTESEAGLQRINGLVDTLIERNVKAVFVESSVSAKNMEALLEGARSKGHQVTVGGTLFSDAMGLEGTYEGTYLGMLDHNLTTTAISLGGTVDPKGFQAKLSSDSISHGTE